VFDGGRLSKVVGSRERFSCDALDIGPVQILNEGGLLTLRIGEAPGRIVLPSAGPPILAQAP